MYPSLTVAGSSLLPNARPRAVSSDTSSRTTRSSPGGGRSSGGGASFGGGATLDPLGLAAFASSGA